MAAAADTDPTLAGPFIPLHYHFQMLADRERMEGFRTAIDYLLPAGGKAVDLGGGTGALSYFAALKAARVWCVELNPELSGTARQLLALNGVGAKVEVVEGDAAAFVPPEPVDLVICEMLHSALLREKQLQVINAFKRHYLARHPGRLPAFAPEATFLAAQPVEQDFTFCGYRAPVPLFCNPLMSQDATAQLGEPVVYQLLRYHLDFSEQIAWEGTAAVNRTGKLNALRFITKNVLAIITQENRTLDWHNFYLVLPLPAPVEVRAGDTIGIRFAYPAGGEIKDLSRSLEVRRL